MQNEETLASIEALLSAAPKSKNVPKLGITASGSVAMIYPEGGTTILTVEDAKWLGAELIAESERAKLLTAQRSGNQSCPGLEG